MTTATTTHLRRRAGLAIVVLGAAVIAAATLTPSDQQVYSPQVCVFCGALGGVDFTLNVLLFVPLGLGLSLSGTTLWRALFLLAATTFAIETLQIFVVPGRDASMGDVIANCAGGLAGWFVSGHLSTILRPGGKTARRLVTAWLLGWLSIQALSGYATRPAPSLSPYYGRIGRPLRSNPPYAGRILAATLNGDPIPDMRLPRTGSAVDALRAGKGFTFRGIVMPARPVAQVSPIAQIVARDGEEVFLAAARESDFVFGARSGASVLRLRPTYYRLSEVLGGSRPNPRVRPDIISLVASYEPPRILLRAIEGDAKREGVILLSASAGWRLFSPVQTYLDGSISDLAVNAVWLFLLLFPAGYWFAHVASNHRVPVGVTAVLAMIVGLGLGPVAFGLRAALWTEAFGVLAGFGSGLVGAKALVGRSLRGDNFQTPAVEETLSQPPLSTPSDISG